MIHSAATVRFDHSLEEARRINVEGTRHILDFAAGARQLRSFAYVGTAYVAGERTDLVRENELAIGQSYRNTYEQTKAEAEALVRSRLGSLPGVILRPSIIVGDSRTGVTSSFKMMYWPLKIYARRLWRTVPGYPDAVLDIVPVDFVAKAVARFSSTRPPWGSTVHLCAGPRGSATIEQVAHRAMEYFNGPEPRYVDPKFFFAVVRPLLFMSLWGRKRRVLRDGRAYRDYFTMRMQFDTSNAERLLQPAGMCPPPVLDYLDRLFHYCVASDWGRKPVSASMSILLRYQLARDRGVTVANLVDELVRRKGNCEVSVDDAGPFHLSELHAEICSIDAFLRRSIALRPASLLPSIAPTTGDASIGFLPSSAPEASRFR